MFLVLWAWQICNFRMILKEGQCWHLLSFGTLGQCLPRLKPAKAGQSFAQNVGRILATSNPGRTEGSEKQFVPFFYESSEITK